MGQVLDLFPVEDILLILCCGWWLSSNALRLVVVVVVVNTNPFLFVWSLKLQLCCLVVAQRQAIEFSGGPIRKNLLPLDE